MLVICTSLSLLLLYLFFLLSLRLFCNPLLEATCISLPSRGRKRRRIVQKAWWHALRLRFAEGCSPSPWVDSPVYVTAGYRHYLQEHPHRVGHIGAAVAHLRVWQGIQGSGPRIVLEDDVSFCPGFRRRLSRALRRLEDQQWDLLLLGFACPCSLPACRHSEAGLGWTGVAPVQYFVGLWGYAVNGQESAQKLASSVLPLDQPVDHQLSALLQKGRVSVWGCVPHLVYHPGAMEVCSARYTQTTSAGGYVSDTNLRPTHN